MGQPSFKIEPPQIVLTLLKNEEIKQTVRPSAVMFNHNVKVHPVKLRQLLNRAVNMQLIVVLSPGDLSGLRQRIRNLLSLQNQHLLEPSAITGSRWSTFLERKPAACIIFFYLFKNVLLV